MCEVCDGLSPEELLDRQVENIETYGYTLLSVTAEVQWTYSIGLCWHLDVPELIVVGWPPEDAAAVIRRVVEEVEREGVGLRCGSVLRVGEGSVGLGTVAPDNLVGDWFAQWHRVARASAHGHQSLRALQAQPSCASKCGEPHDLLDHALAQRTTPGRIERARTRRLSR